MIYVFTGLCHQVSKLPRFRCDARKQPFQHGLLKLDHRVQKPGPEIIKCIGSSFGASPAIWPARRPKVRRPCPKTLCFSRCCCRGGCACGRLFACVTLVLVWLSHVCGELFSSEQVFRIFTLVFYLMHWPEAPRRTPTLGNGGPLTFFGASGRPRFWYRILFY